MNVITALANVVPVVRLIDTTTLRTDLTRIRGIDENDLDSSEFRLVLNVQRLSVERPRMNTVIVFAVVLASSLFSVAYTAAEIL